MITTDATAIVLEYEPVPSDQVIDGAPHTGWVALHSTAQGEWGVWEMTPGAMRDIEVDETFVVVAGRATLEREGGGVSWSEELFPGVCVTVRHGEETIWRVSETLRKVYLATAP